MDKINQTNERLIDEAAKQLAQIFLLQLESENKIKIKDQEKGQETKANYMNNL